MSHGNYTFPELVQQRYSPEVCDFIRTMISDFVQVEMISDDVFSAHKIEETMVPFQSEEHRLEWLLEKSHILALEHIKKQNEKEKAKAL